MPYLALYLLYLIQALTFSNAKYATFIAANTNNSPSSPATTPTIFGQKYGGATFGSTAGRTVFGMDGQCASYGFQVSLFPWLFSYAGFCLCPLSHCKFLIISPLMNLSLRIPYNFSFDESAPFLFFFATTTVQAPSMATAAKLCDAIGTELNAESRYVWAMVRGCTVKLILMFPLLYNSGRKRRYEDDLSRKKFRHQVVQERNGRSSM